MAGVVFLFKNKLIILIMNNIQSSIGMHGALHISRPKALQRRDKAAQGATMRCNQDMFFRPFSQPFHKTINPRPELGSRFSIR